jgi:5-methylcytosine-specific restriction endonuclease McrA
MKTCRSGLHQYEPVRGSTNGCPKCHSIGTLRWQRKNPEKRSAQSHRHYLKHSEEIKKRTGKWKKNNHALRSATQHEYYVSNRDKVLSSIKTWGIKNRKRLNLLYAKKNAARRSKVSGGAVTPGEWDSILKFYNGLCAYCSKHEWEHLEHVIPLSKGGTHSPDNVVPSCASCNLSKGSKLIEPPLRPQSF